MIEIIGELLRGRDNDPSLHEEVDWVAMMRRNTINGLVHVTGVVREMADQQVAIAQAEEEHRQASLGAVAATGTQPEQLAEVHDITDMVQQSAEPTRIGVTERPEIPLHSNGQPDIERIRADVKAA